MSMETTASQSITPRRPQQLRLFPDAEEDATIYGMSDTYRRLDETGQRIVRGYLVALNESGDWPSQSKIASASGLGRSTVCEKLKSDVAIMAAVTEIISMTRDDLARRTSIAIPALAALIIRQFLPGEGKLPRDTRTLTKTELDVLRLSSVMGGVAIGSDGQPASLTIGTRVNADGVAETAVKLTAGDSASPNVSLDSVIKSLINNQQQQIQSGEQGMANVVRVEDDAQ